MNEPSIITETDDYFVINKPAGWGVEPPSHGDTILDWLTANKKITKSDWPEDSRYGVVHRLDTDTSGVLLWAKNPAAQEKLKLLWQGRQVEKTYLALVIGECEKEGTVELALARDNKNDRQKVVWVGEGRPAITTYKTIGTVTVGEKAVSLIEAHPITGRTHQIRVHMKAIEHPIIGDKLYGDKNTDRLAESLGIKRQMLHAWKLKLPDTAEYSAILPADFSAALKLLHFYLEF
ncbi:MAG TPA: RluA family pseudouridine synthase [Candidatus Saccharimonadales bacterium]|nr:RluA family pseudouridine synthase [Candidatus Saccharimonadales bacterium]